MLLKIAPYWCGQPALPATAAMWDFERKKTPNEFSSLLENLVCSLACVEGPFST
jgi:hypothetical protein